MLPRTLEKTHCSFLAGPRGISSCRSSHLILASETLWLFVSLTPLFTSISKVLVSEPVCPRWAWQVSFQVVFFGAEPESKEVIHWEKENG
jgi:hypothetical protein